MYDAPADLNFAEAIAKVPIEIHLALYENETSQQLQLASAAGALSGIVGRCRAWDGTAGIVQPLIMPLYDGKSIIELLALLAGDTVTDGHEIVLRTWADLLPTDVGFDLALRKVIEAGLLEGKRVNPARRRRCKASDLSRRRRLRQGIYLRFVPTRTRTTAGLPITAGCRRRPTR